VEGIIATVTCSHASGSVFPVGTTIISCSSRDSGDHETIATIYVVVTDTTGPVITVPTVAVQEATAAGGATVTYSVSANDVVEGSKTVTCNKLSGTFMFPVGNNVVTCTSSDSGDFETTANFHVLVVDTTAPVVTMVATSSLTLESNSTAGGAVFNYTVSAVDVVDGVDLTKTCNQASGSVLPVGNNTVTCSASDYSNNAASASLTVLVTAPTPAPTPLTTPVTAPAPTTSGSAMVAYT
jgi:HYR domain